MRDSLCKLGVPGFHVIRRFRVTHPRDQGTPEGILRFWIGHGDKSITDRYSKMSRRIQTRKEWAKRPNLASICPNFVPNVPKRASFRFRKMPPKVLQFKKLGHQVPGSSTVEHSAVNRRVASSNLARGANFFLRKYVAAMVFLCCENE